MLARRTALIGLIRTAQLVAALFLHGACGQWSSDTAQLRITNVGTAPILRLSVLFPEDRVSFGDLAIGATSPYVEVPHGVYSYAAYRLEIGGALVTQPVIDWVGEEPMVGSSFTYALDVNPNRSELQIVQLVSVTRDD